MCSRVCGALAAAMFIVGMTLGTICAGQALADSAGTVHFVRFSEPSFDQYLENPSPSTQAWLNAHLWRMGVYAPYFDNKTAWYPNGWLYKDSYALYTNESTPDQHPEWVLKDAAGNPLYIQWGCSNGACPQYAADIANRAFRQWWIAKAKAELSSGDYRGLFIDDVNMEMRVSNGREETVAPIDPATGQPMSAAAWRAYMAQFMQETRTALPGVELIHNAIWFSDDDAGTSEASIRGEISASNCIFLERGVNDSGLTGGDGQWSLNAFLSFVDQVHALGRGVVLDGGATEPQGLEYNLAAYFLVSTGNDAVSGGGQTPTNWWAGWNVSLGAAAGPRYDWNNLLRRDFTGGTVLVNPPEAPTRTVTLSSPMQNVNGETVTSVTLAPASGAILRNTSSTAGAPELTSPAPAEAIVATTPVGSPTAPSAQASGSGVEAYIGQNAPHPALPPAGRRGRRATHHGSGERSGGAGVGGDAVLARNAHRARGHRRARAARHEQGHRAARRHRRLHRDGAGSA
jgi:hypothetical protein